MWEREYDRYDGDILLKRKLVVQNSFCSFEKSQKNVLDKYFSKFNISCFFLNIYIRFEKGREYVK